VLRSKSLLLSRRDILLGGASSLALAGLAAPAQGQAGTALAILQNAAGEGRKFDPSLLIEAARALSKRPFQPPGNDLPEPFASLSYEAYVSLRLMPERRIWNGEQRGFLIEPLHRGFLYQNNVLLHVVEDGIVRRLAYDRTAFDFGKITPAAHGGDLGFSGFRLFASQGSEGLTECAILQGATFLRALARGQTFGTSARILTLRPAETRGEEFPVFRGFWLERPQTGTGVLIVHGLLDSESASGVVRMTLRFGDVTMIDIEMTLFARAALDHIGFGGMAATYLFGANDRRGIDDLRPAVHEISGLQMLSGSGEWIWRPLHNPDTLQISAFQDLNPKGFGLMQRERDPALFADDDQGLEKRPSLWIEPLGEWGSGVIQLIEIPNDSEVNDNILAYWRPKTAIPAGGEASLAYRQFWGWDTPQPPALAMTAQTRTGRGQGRRRKFMIDFTGEKLLAVPFTEIRPIVSGIPGTLHGIRLQSLASQKGIRLLFELDPGNETACELRAVLEQAGKPISETWLCRWTP
jgi:periplasmic glucans biosynthesis protein